MIFLLCLNMSYNIPSNEEQVIAEKYVLGRVINRPDTDLKKMMKYVLLFLILNILRSTIIFHIIPLIFSLRFISEELIFIFVSNSLIIRGVIFIGLLLSDLIFHLRCAIIGIIRLYQHYADEEIRRRCLFEPTCSEYTILALKKYGIIGGLIKSYDRLFNRCKGNIYRIDYP